MFHAEVNVQQLLPAVVLWFEQSLGVHQELPTSRPMSKNVWQPLPEHLLPLPG
jgi:hypothetical protein